MLIPSAVTNASNFGFAGEDHAPDAGTIAKASPEVCLRFRARREMDESLHKYAEADLPLCEAMAAVYATLGDTDRALDWLDRAVCAGNEQAEWFQRNPLLANIQQQPRFKQIVESIVYRRGQRQTPSR